MVSCHRKGVPVCPSSVLCADLLLALAATERKIQIYTCAAASEELTVRFVTLEFSQAGTEHHEVCALCVARGSRGLGPIALLLPHLA